MKRYSPLTYFNNWKLGTKMFFAFIVGAIVPIVLTQIIFYSKNISFMIDKVNELTVNNLNQISERTDLTLEVYTNLLYQIYVDDDMIFNINKLLDDSTDGKAEAYNRVFNRLKQYNIEEKGVRNISIICEDGTAITYDYETGSSLYNLWNGNKDMRQIQPYLDTVDKIGMVISPTMKFVEDGEEKYFFHISKRMFDLNNLGKGTIATVVMSIDTDVLHNICQMEVDQETHKEYGITFIINEKRQVIFYPRAMFMGITLDEELSISKLIEVSGLLKGKELTINDYYDGKTGWTFYYAYDRDYMLKDIKSVQKSFVFIGIIAVIFASSLIVYTVQKIVNSVSNVIQGMNEIKGGNLEVMVPVDHEDEIGQIAHNFNDMTEEIRGLIAEVKDATDKKKNAEIRALEAQINPHFLYNTLDSINWRAIEKGEYEISNMLRNMGVILRYSINKSNEMVSIEEIGDWLDKYISLQQMRFNGAFTYKLSIGEDVAKVKIYKLLLQPFVENTIIHGFSGIESGGMIRIDIMKDEAEDQICIIIEDNGVGMSKELTDHYNDREKVIKEEGRIGMHNAFARMQIYYGERAKWKVTSVKGMGTVITLKLPI